MRIKELKKNIAELVEVTEDKEALQMVFEILEDRMSNQNGDILDELKPAQIKKLDKSLEQIEKGQVVGHQVVMQRLKRIVDNGKKRKVV